MKHGSRTREDTRKHTEEHPLIIPSLNHMSMIITVFTTMTITHTMGHTQQNIYRYGSQNENRRNSGVDSIVHQMGQKSK